MSTSLLPVKIPSATWADLYAETGIVVGTKIIIQNTGSNNVRVSEATSEPKLSDGYNKLLPNDYVASSDTPIGVWAYAQIGTTLQVEEG